MKVLLEKKIKLLKGDANWPGGYTRHQFQLLPWIMRVTLLNNHPSVQLTTVFGPQHGIWGETQDNMIEWNSYQDPRTGLPFFSLYGETRKPTPRYAERMLIPVVIDLQDVLGRRYYTYIYTMALTMEACAELGKKVIVLDRPNPIRRDSSRRTDAGPCLQILCRIVSTASQAWYDHWRAGPLFQPGIPHQL